MAIGTIAASSSLQSRLAIHEVSFFAAEIVILSSAAAKGQPIVISATTFTPPPDTLGMGWPPVFQDDNDWLHTEADFSRRLPAFLSPQDND